MNHYGRLAEAAWLRHVPARVHEMANPTEFFREVGDRVADQVERVVGQLAADLPDGMPPEEKAARLQAIRRHAEEIAQKDLIFDAIDDELTKDPVARLQNVIRVLIHEVRIDERIRHLQEQAEQGDDRTGPGVATPVNETTERIQQLRVLRSLLDLDTESLTPRQAENRIAQLQEFWPLP